MTLTTCTGCPFFPFIFFLLGCNICECDIMKKVAKFDPPSVKHHRRRNQESWGGGGGGVAAPLKFLTGGLYALLKIGVNSTNLTGCEEHVHFTRRVKNSLEGQRTCSRGKEHGRRVKKLKNIVKGSKGI